MKKITIIKHNDGELANQLWNYISIYAYSLETGAKVENPSFFEYHNHFNLLKKESAVTKFFSYWFRGTPHRRAHWKHRLWRKIYKVYVHIVQAFERKNIISSESSDGGATYLPPTADLPALKGKNRIYFAGWLFRNPAGLRKWRRELIPQFTPASPVEKRVTDIAISLREKYQRVIGVHIRQADYKVFKGGTYFMSQEKVRSILNEYISKNSFTINTTLFLMTSDGSMDPEAFKGLNVYISKEDAVTDLFLLSSTDAIIGSDSSFGAFASWYGNIPHITMKNGPMDWDYYADKREFFENKYLTMVQY
jgi:hypothetical protein